MCSLGLFINACACPLCAHTYVSSGVDRGNPKNDDDDDVENYVVQA